jgi:hypothetical protein
MNIDSPISKIANLAKDKGFKAKTLSTIHTFEHFTNQGKNFKINDTCLFLLACEIQTWLREVHNIDVFVNRDSIFNKGTYCLFIYDNINDIPRSRPLDNDVFSGYPTYEKALEAGLKEALKLIVK